MALTWEDELENSQFEDADVTTQMFSSGYTNMGFYPEIETIEIKTQKKEKVSTPPKIKDNRRAIIF